MTDFTPGVINVYDKGYVDYNRLDQIHEAGGCEHFFKWLKQHSKVKHFFATDEVGAVKQIYLSLILYCLLALFKQNMRTDATLNKIRVAIRASLYSTFEGFKRKIMRLNPF
ncbi:hypothetical protein ACR6HW_06250 [Fusibacter sp. JL298sf-3]